MMEGKVNGVDVSILLDSGASISVVPEVMVSPELRTGETVAVKPFGSKVPPTAEVSFQMGHLGRVEHVALAPVEDGCENEVLYGLDLMSTRGLELVLMAHRLKPVDVLRVTTRSEAKEASQREEEEANVVAEEQPIVRPVVEQMNSGESTGEGKPVADRPAGGPEPVASENVMGEKRSEEDCLDEMEEECDVESLVEGEDAYVVEEKEDVQFELRAEGREEVDLVIPPVMHGNASRAELVEETMVDPSLKNWRDLAEKGEQGFLWKVSDNDYPCTGDGPPDSSP